MRGSARRTVRIPHRLFLLWRRRWEGTRMGHACRNIITAELRTRGLRPGAKDTGPTARSHEQRRGAESADGSLILPPRQRKLQHFEDSLPSNLQLPFSTKSTWPMLVKGAILSSPLEYSTVLCCACTAQHALLVGQREDRRRSRRRRSERNCSRRRLFFPVTVATVCPIAPCW